jgi:hypothetical protein
MQNRGRRSWMLEPWTNARRNEDVLLGDATTRASALNLAEIHIVFTSQLANERR